MSLVLRARSLWKSYAAGVAGCSARVWVLQGASLDVHRGECVAILGARGAGTTTLLQCLAGVRRTDAGLVERSADCLLVDAGWMDRSTAPNDARSDRSSPLLLWDDAHGTPAWRAAMLVERHRVGRRGAIVIATHELAGVRAIADRVLLLRQGRLAPLDLASGARRVAERTVDGTRPSAAVTAAVTSGRRAPARPGTVRA